MIQYTEFNVLLYLNSIELQLEHITQCFTAWLSVTEGVPSRDFTFSLGACGWMDVYKRLYVDSCHHATTRKLSASTQLDVYFLFPPSSL
jgi:hypothetical protein